MESSLNYKWEMGVTGTVTWNVTRDDSDAIIQSWHLQQHVVPIR